MEHALIIGIFIIVVSSGYFLCSLKESVRIAIFAAGRRMPVLPARVRQSFRAEACRASGASECLQLFSPKAGLLVKRRAISRIRRKNASP
jgi:hypothetical protein